MIRFVRVKAKFLVEFVYLAFINFFVIYILSLAGDCLSMSELGVERPTTLPVLPLPESQEERRVHFGDGNNTLRNEGKRGVDISCVR